MSRERGRRREFCFFAPSSLTLYHSRLCPHDANNSAIRGEMSISLLQDAPSPDEYLIKQRQVSLDKELLQLVQGACKADNLQRALDLTRLMHNSGSVDAAAKIAGFYHLPGLQERMGGVRLRKKVKREYPLVYGNGNCHGSGSGNGGGGGGGEKTKGFNDFTRNTARRSFGGKVRDRDSTPATGNGTGNGNGTYIPETPRTEMEMESTPVPAEDSVMGSPDSFSDFKRKREEEDFEPVVKKVEPSFKGTLLFFFPPRPSVGGWLDWWIR